MDETQCFARRVQNWFWQDNRTIRVFEQKTKYINTQNTRNIRTVVMVLETKIKWQNCPYISIFTDLLHASWFWLRSLLFGIIELFVTWKCNQPTHFSHRSVKCTIASTDTNLTAMGRRNCLRTPAKMILHLRFIPPQFDVLVRRNNYCPSVGVTNESYLMQTHLIVKQLCRFKHIHFFG